MTAYLSAGAVSVRLRGSDPAVYTHKDHLGSPLAATDAAGAVLWREQYNPFGEKRLDPAGNRDDEGYTGHVSDSATGLIYMQARYTDPVTGRFLTTDPIGYQDQLNLYAYVANDPMNGTDPTGEFGVLGAVVGALVGAGIEAGKQLASEGKISDVGAVAKEVAICGAIGALGGAGGALLRGGVTGTLKLGAPGAAAVQTAGKFVAKRTTGAVSKMADKIASTAGKGVIEAPVSGAIARSVTSANGAALAAGAGVISENHQSSSTGQSPEIIEGAAEGVANAIVPGSGEVIDKMTDGFKEMDKETS